MKIIGSYSLDHPPAAVFAALNDPAVLLLTIPGCQALEQTGSTSYAMTITAGVASIKGTYNGVVELADQNAPHAFTLKASGSGGPGTVQADVKVTLAESAEGCALTYEADAVVGGVIGGVGQRVLSGVSKKTANEFFEAVNRYLAGDRRSTAVVQDSETGKVSIRKEAANRPASSISSLLAGGALALAGVILGWLITR
ncbi:MAG: carbon monoxide dehydrogenase subunit G [Actinobacteria bacterium]|nr:carbon monoxide dehydrogenase subunit G [Actinomycetota bacterium]